MLVVTDAQPTELDNCIAHIEAAGILPDQPLISAVSGGADSLALAVLMQKYCDRHGQIHHAVIVDHGLRAASKTEAEQAKYQLAQLGISADIKTVKHPRPAGGIQEFARQHRLSLLAEEGRRHGAAVCFGHHQLDQAETIYMRLSNNSGIRGLIGMPEKRMHEGCLFVRPLLEITPNKLLHICHEEGLRPVHDPSNEDRRFERVRARHHLQTNAKLGAQLLRLGDAARLLAAPIDKALQEATAEHLFWELPYFGRVNVDAFLRLPALLRHRLLSLMIQKIGCNAHMASSEAISRLDDRLRDGLSGTLGGCMVHNTGEDITCVREARHLPSPVVLEDNPAGKIFDECWLITGPAGLRFTALGAQRYAALSKQHKLRQFLVRWPYSARLRFPVVDPLDAEAEAHHFKDIDAWAKAQEQAADQYELHLPLADTHAISSWHMGQTTPADAFSF